MKRIATPAIALATLALTAPAFAGGYSEPVVEQPVMAAPVPVAAGTDWTGGYAGATLGYGWADGALDDGDDMTYGVFGGYDYDFGNFVLGGELEYNATELENDTADLDNLTRLKLRAGYDMGKTLVYGVVGAAYAEADIDGSSYSDTGYVYGVGMDYLMTDNVSVGAELLQNEFDGFDGSGSDLSATTLGARVSFRF